MPANATRQQAVNVDVDVDEDGDGDEDENNMLSNNIENIALT